MSSFLTDFFFPFIFSTGANREKFSAKKFAEKYNLSLLAGNFYQAQWDDYVPQLHAQLGF